MIRLPISLIGTLLLCAAPVFGTTVSFTASPLSLSGNPGDELIYSGTIVASSDVLLNGICFSFTAAPCDNDNSPGLGFLTLDTDPFFLNVTGTFSAGDSFTSPMFGVVIDPSAAAGTYSGTVTLLGGADFFAVAPQGSGTFQLTVLSPEPASFGYLLLGTGLLALVRRVRGNIPAVSEHRAEARL